MRENIAISTYAIMNPIKTTNSGTTSKVYARMGTIENYKAIACVEIDCDIDLDNLTDFELASCVSVVIFKGEKRQEDIEDEINGLIEIYSDIKLGQSEINRATKLSYDEIYRIIYKVIDKHISPEARLLNAVFNDKYKKFWI